MQTSRPKPFGSEAASDEEASSSVTPKEEVASPSGAPPPAGGRVHLVPATDVTKKWICPAVQCGHLSISIRTTCERCRTHRNASNMKAYTLATAANWLASPQGTTRSRSRSRGAAAEPDGPGLPEFTQVNVLPEKEERHWEGTELVIEPSSFRPERASWGFSVGAFIRKCREDNKEWGKRYQKSFRLGDTKVTWRTHTEVWDKAARGDSSACTQQQNMIKDSNNDARQRVVSSTNDADRRDANDRRAEPEALQWFPQHMFVANGH